MPKGISTKCIVRIAENDEILLKDFSVSPDTKIEEIPISKVMEVELIDFSEQKNFEIRRLNSSEQTIDSNQFTQWLFFVKPLSIGIHTLFLKVSVVQYIHNKERKKEIVLERQINVVSEVAQLPQEQDNAKWNKTNVYVISTKKDRIDKNSPKRRIKILGVSFSLIGFIAMATLASAMGITAYLVFDKLLRKEKSYKDEKIETQIQNRTSLNPASTKISDTLKTDSKGEKLEEKEKPRQVKKIETQTQNKASSNPKLVKVSDTLKTDFTKEKLQEEEKSSIKVVSAPPNQISGVNDKNSNIVGDEKSTTKNLNKRQEDNGLKNILEQTKKSSYKLVGEIFQKDSIEIGNNILIRVTTNGFKPNTIDFYIDKKYKIRPRAKDGQDYFFELKSTKKDFSFQLSDKDSGNSIEQKLSGNKNYHWVVKRKVSGSIDIGVD